MINPALIRKKKSPTAFCLFAAAARTGQRAQTPPAWKIHVGSICAVPIIKENPLVVAILH